LQIMLFEMVMHNVKFACLYELPFTKYCDSSGPQNWETRNIRNLWCRMWNSLPRTL